MTGGLEQLLNEDASSESYLGHKRLQVVADEDMAST